MSRKQSRTLAGHLSTKTGDRAGAGDQTRDSRLDYLQSWQVVVSVFDSLWRLRTGELGRQSSVTRSRAAGDRLCTTTGNRPTGTSHGQRHPGSGARTAGHQTGL